MSELIGTVHKPQRPPIREPEGWTFMYRLIDSEGTWPWRFGVTELRGREWAESRALDFARGRELVRLVHIGPAPKVPVEAIRMVYRIADLSRASRAIPLSQKEEDAITTLLSWLSAQEEGDK